MQVKADIAPTKKTVGEPMVWVTAMGLGVGLLMVAYLLGLIVVSGTSAFWPRRVAYLTLRAESQARFPNAAGLAGEIITKQTKLSHRLQRIKETTAEASLEWQLFLGNKETYGLSFRYVDQADITAVSYPPDIMMLERLEYGDAIGIPVALHIEGEGEVMFDDAAFVPRFTKLVQETVERRKEIRRIERGAIGAINARMDDLRLQQKALERDPAANSQQVQTIQEHMSVLQQRYETLAEQARALRSKQEKDFLTYHLPTGEEQRLPAGQLVSFYFPNQLTFFERIGLCMHNFWVFLSAEPREANTEGGVFPAIFGTFVMTVLMSLAVTPFGVLAAMYLREYARQGFIVRAVRIAVNNLAGVPSIVFGVFGLGFFVYIVGGTIDHLFYSLALPTPTFGTGGILWASLTLALMTVPVVIVATEEALAAVPRGMREGSLACGASKWQTMQRIVLPASAPGILTGLILAMARGAGEVAPLMLVGVVKLAPTLPVDGIFPFVHLDRKFMHLGFHIFDLGFQSPDSEAAKPMVFATTLLLIILVVLLNLGAIYIRDRLRRKYATGAF